MKVARKEKKIHGITKRAKAKAKLNKATMKKEKRPWITNEDTTPRRNIGGQPNAISAVSPDTVQGIFRTNPHWNKRCDTCNNVGHIKNDCRASQQTIARGMQQKAEWEAKGGGKDDGKGKKGRKGKKGKGDGGDKGKPDGGADGLNAAGGGAAAVPPP